MKSYTVQECLLGRWMTMIVCNSHKKAMDAMKCLMIANGGCFKVRVIG
jgi:hypothetical protein